MSLISLRSSRGTLKFYSSVTGEKLVSFTTRRTRNFRRQTFKIPKSAYSFSFPRSFRNIVFSKFSRILAPKNKVFRENLQLTKKY